MIQRPKLTVNDSDLKTRELPLFFSHLTSTELTTSKIILEVRMVKSAFYDTNKHLLTYPYKVMI